MLITHKLSDYLIFKQCYEIIDKGGHLTEKGLLDILSLKSSLNLGLSHSLNIAFPNIIKKDRPNYIFKGIPDPYWVSGFTSGDGSFHIIIRPYGSCSASSGLNSVNNKILTRARKAAGLQGVGGVLTRFGIHLHIRELEVLRGLATYLNLFNTNVETQDKKVSILEKSVNLQISKTSDINNIIIPFFNKYPILGMKSQDFEDFKRICNIINTKNHQLSPSDYETILNIKLGMNLNRK